MLDCFTINNKTLDARVGLNLGSSATLNSSISVIIGRNGSRKSYFLRQVLEAALQSGGSAEGANSKLDISTFGWENQNPESLICISGTPLDRFPRTRNISLGIKKKKEGKEFLYLGLRATNGVAGVAQSQRSLMAALFLNSGKLERRKQLFENVFESIGFKSELVISLKPNSELDNHFKVMREYTGAYTYLAKDVIEDYAEKIVKDFIVSVEVDSLENRIKEVLVDIENFDFKINGIFKLWRWLNADERPSLLFKDGVIQFQAPSWGGWGLNELETFVRIGLIEVDKVIFRKYNRNFGDNGAEHEIVLVGEELSSGQWGWIAGLAGLCAHISDNSLVLVDEPENSLHPVWQQKFIPLLNSILREFPGSQAIVATHSPLIASGVDPEWGGVQALVDQGVNESGQQIIRSESIGSTFGWRASDVYEDAFGVDTSRAPSFTRTADIALGLIRSGRIIGSDEYNLLTEKLAMDLNSLPMTDPLRNILASIIKDLKMNFESKGVF